MDENDFVVVEMLVLQILLVVALFSIVCCYACLPNGWSNPAKQTRDVPDRFKHAPRFRKAGTTYAPKRTKKARL
jgi:hypothetical protein